MLKCCNCSGPSADALMQVAAVQREVVEKLLTKAVFQRHMTAVREVLNMLRFAQKIRDDGELWDNTAIKVCVLVIKSLQDTYRTFTTVAEGLGYPIWHPLLSQPGKDLWCKVSPADSRRAAGSSSAVSSSALLLKLSPAPAALCYFNTRRSYLAQGIRHGCKSASGGW